MSLPIDTFLHVVYAGRGDAFILEYTTAGPTRHLVLVDGGPVGLGGAQNRQAPYYKYLFQSLRAVWHARGTSTDTISVDAIVCSHPHADHIEGLTHLVKNMDVRGSLFNFRGPFVVPNAPDGELTRLRGVFRAKGFVLKAGGWNPSTVPGISAQYPTDDLIQVYNKGGGPLGEVDRDKVNKRSILMSTDPAATTGAGRVYMTGDNVGYIIAPQLRALRPSGVTPPPLPRVAIYKIQHHGSRNNSLLDEAWRGIGTKVEREAALLSFLAYYINPVSTARLVYRIPTEAITYMGDRVKTKLGGTDAAVLQYHTELVARRDRYKRAIINRTVTETLQPEQGGRFPAWMTVWPDDLMRQVAELCDGLAPTAAGFGIFWDPMGVTPTTRHRQGWWIDWLKWDGFCPDYAGLLAIPGTRAFYGTFLADAYVISANHTFLHPSPAVLIGLAQALQDQARSAPVYLTEAETLSWSDIVELCVDAGTTAAQLFGPTGPLRIMYRSRGFYFTLNGNGVFSGANRDISGRTRLFDFSPGAGVSRTDLANQLESDTAVLPPRATIANPNSMWYQVSCTINRVTYYLAFTGTTPTASTVSPPMRFIVYDATDPLPGAATGTAPAAEATSLDPYIRVGWQAPGATALSYFLFRVLKRTGRRDDDTLAWSLAFLAPHPASGASISTSFYVDSAGLVGTLPYEDPPPPGYEFAHFQFDLVPSAAAPPRIAMGRHAAPVPSLRDFYTAMGLTVPAAVMCGDALSALLGPEVLTQLDITLAFETAALGWQIDADKTTVDFDDQAISATVHAVAMTFVLRPGTTVPFESGSLPVLSATLAVTWPDDTGDPDTPFLFDLVVRAARSVTLSCNHPLSNVIRPTTLRKCLLGMGATDDALATLRVPRLMSFLVGDASTVFEALLNTAPAFLLKAGMARLAPDLDASRCDAQWTPVGRVAINRADVVCKVAGVPGWGPQTVAGIGITLGDLTLTVLDTLGPRQQISLTGSATLSAVDVASTATYVSDTAASAAVVALGFSCVLNKSGTELVFSISGVDTVASLPQLLPGVGDVTQLKTPFSASALGQMQSSAIGFSLRQASGGVTTYDIASVFAVVSFDDWLSFLPGGFPLGGIDENSIVIRALVTDPRDSDLRTVAVNIEFSVELADPLPPRLNFRLAAEPLITADAYEFRLTVGAPPVTVVGAPTGLTLANVCQAVGMGDVSAAIASGVPILGQVLTDIQVVELSVAIVQAASDTATYTFGDWALSLFIDSFVLVPGLLTISQATLDLKTIGSLFSCEAQGSIVLGSGATSSSVDVVLRTPTQDMPGNIAITAPAGLSVADVMAALDLPDLTSLPVIGTLVNIAVHSVQCTLGYPEDSKDLACLGAQLELRLDELDLGVLDLGALRLSVEYHDARDPIGPGYDQKAFSIKALLADGALAAAVAYDTHLGILSASLVQVEPVALADLLKIILPSTVGDVLSGVIEGFQFEDASVVLDTNTNSITSFVVNISRDATLSLGTHTLTSPLTLTSLTLAYTAATKGPPATPDRLDILGALQKDAYGAMVSISCIADGGQKATPDSTVTVSLSIVPISATSLPLTGFVSLLQIGSPIYTPPLDCPTFDNLQVGGISGKVAITTTSTSSTATTTSLSIISLDASVVSTGEINVLPLLDIALADVRLDLHYENSNTTGSISGFLRIDKVGGLWLLFEKTDKAEVYSVDFSLDPATQSADATDIFHTFLKPDEWQMPDDLGIPSALPLVNISARIRRGVSIDVWGFGSVNQPGWAIAASGVELTTGSLGGRIRVLEPPPPPPNVVSGRVSGRDPPATRTYDVYLIGRVSFTGFSTADGAEARLNVKTGEGVTFTAQVNKTVAGSQLDALSKQLDADPGSDWSSIVPQDTAVVSLDQQGIYLYANLAKGQTRFALYGAVTGIGSLLLLGRPNITPGATGRSYFVSLVVQDLSMIWSRFSDVMGVFDFGMLVVAIMAYDGTLANLSDDLKALPAQFAADGIHVPDASTVIGPLLPADGKTPLGRGVIFFGSLNFGSAAPKAMTGGFDMAADASNTGTVTVWAQVANVPGSTKIGITIIDLALLGGAIVINGAGAYGNEILTVPGVSVVVTLPGTADPITFTASLTVTPDTTSFTVATSALTLPSPFGDMFSVTLQNLGIAGDISRQQKGAPAVASYAISAGDVLLGGKSTGLGATIVFPGGRPQIAMLNAMSLDILDVFMRIIQYEPPSPSPPPASRLAAGHDNLVTTGSPGSWPSIYNPFSVSDAVIYYNSGAVYTDKSRTYQPGYNISAVLSLFDVDFSLDICIPASRAGVVIVGTSIGVVDLKFIQLGPFPPSAPTSKGPMLSIDTTQATSIYKFEAGVVFFGLPGIDIALQYQKDGGQDTYTGTLSYDGTILGYPNPSIGVSYNSTADKWSLGPWDVVQDLANVIDIIKEIIKASETSPKATCGSLVGLLLDNVTVTATPSLSFVSGTDPSPTSQASTLLDDPKGKTYLALVFEVTFTLNLVGKPIYTLEVPPDLNTIPPQRIDTNFDTSSLGRLVLSVLVEFAQDLALAVIKNGKALAALISYMAISQFGQQLVTNLLCYGCDNPELKQAADDWGKKDHNQGGDDGKKSKNFFDEVPTSALIAAAVGLVAAGVAAIASVQATADAMKNLLNKVLRVFGGDDPLQALVDEIEDLIGQLNDAKGVADDFIKDAINMSGVPGSGWAGAAAAGGAGAAVGGIEDDGPQPSIVVDWSRVLPNSKDASWYDGFDGFQWIVQANTTGIWEGPGTVTQVVTDSDARSATLTNEDFAYAPTVYAWVTAQYSDYTSAGHADPAKTVHVPYLRPPTVTFASTAANLVVKVLDSSGTMTKGQYLVQIAGTAVDERKLVMFQQTVTDPPAEGVIVQWDQLPPAIVPWPVSLSAYAQAVSSDPTKAHDSVFVTSADSFPLLPLPTDVTVSPADAAALDMMVSWKQPGDAPAPPSPPDYDIEVRDSNLGIISPVTITPQSTPTGQRTARFSSTKFSQLELIAVAVRAHPPTVAPPGAISIFTAGVQAMVAPFVAPLVDLDMSFWDIPTQELQLLVGFGFDIPSVVSFQVKTGSSDKPLEIVSTTVVGDRATIVAKGMGTSPYPSNILVAAAFFECKLGPWSTPWAFPAAAAGGLAPPAPTTTFTQGILNVSWDAVANAASTTVSMTSPDKPPVTVTQTIPYPSLTAGFQSRSFPHGFPMSTIFRLTATSGAPRVHGGGSLDQSITFPDTEGWAAAPQALINSVLVAGNSNVACVSRVPGKTLDVFFTSASGTLEAAHYDATAPAGQQWTAQHLVPSNWPICPPPTGANVTAFSRNDKHAEVMWIAPDGSIAGRVLAPEPGTGPGTWLAADYFAFSRPGVARTDNQGGRIVAGVLPASQSVELFWITPTNQISAVSWTPKFQWSSAATCDGNVMLATDGTPLAVASVDGERMHAFFRLTQLGGAVTGAYRMVPDDPFSWVTYQVGNDTPTSDAAAARHQVGSDTSTSYTPAVAAAAATGARGGIAARALRGKGGVVQWVEADGRVATAWLPGDETAPPFQITPLAGAGAAGSTSALVSVARGSDNAADVVWFDPNGNMTGCETHTDSTGPDASWVGYAFSPAAQTRLPTSISTWSLSTRHISLSHTMATTVQILFDFNQAVAGSSTVASTARVPGLLAVVTTNANRWEPGHFENGVTTFGPNNNVFIVHDAGSAQGASQRYMYIGLVAQSTFTLTSVSVSLSSNASGHSSSNPVVVAVEVSPRDDFINAVSLGNVRTDSAPVQTLALNRQIPSGVTYLRLRATTAIPDGANYIAYSNLQLSASLSAISSIPALELAPSTDVSTASAFTLQYDFSKAAQGAQVVASDQPIKNLVSSFTSTATPFEPGQFNNGVTSFGSNHNVFVLHNCGSAQGQNQKYAFFGVETQVPLALTKIATIVGSNAFGSSPTNPVLVAVEASATQDFQSSVSLGQISTVNGALTTSSILPRGTTYIRFRVTTAIPDGSNYVAYDNVRLSLATDQQGALQALAAVSLAPGSEHLFWVGPPGTVQFRSWQAPARRARPPTLGG